MLFDILTIRDGLGLLKNTHAFTQNNIALKLFRLKKTFSGISQRQAPVFQLPRAEDI